MAKVFEVYAMKRISNNAMLELNPITLRIINADLFSILQKLCLATTRSVFVDPSLD